SSNVYDAFGVARFVSGTAQTQWRWEQTEEEGLVHTGGGDYLPGWATPLQRKRGRGGKERPGGDDPRYRQSCEEPWRLYDAAKGAERAEISRILKLKHCKGSGRSRGKPRPEPVRDDCPKDVREFANCSDAELAWMCLKTAAGIVFCVLACRGVATLPGTCPVPAVAF
ncbi:MAG: hypothetical protein ACP5VE_11085, partial [Chthonomonadales bacterium]